MPLLAEAFIFMWVRLQMNKMIKLKGNGQGAAYYRIRRNVIHVVESNRERQSYIKKDFKTNTRYTFKIISGHINILVEL